MAETTSHPGFRTRREQIRNGGKGALIGTVFGLLWFTFGLAAFHGSAHLVVLVVGLALLAVSGCSVAYLFRLSGRTPADQPGPPVQPGGSGPRFVTIVIIEAVILGAGNNYLRTTLDRPELMYTWSALVVGAHFFPMARKLRAPVLRVLGSVMIAIVALTALTALIPGAAPTVWQAVPGLGCAAALWISAIITGARAGRPSSAVPDDGAPVRPTRRGDAR